MIDLEAPGLNAVRRIAEAVAATPSVRDGHPPRALVVGGFVRDALLRRPLGDADVEVYGLPAEQVEELLHREFPERVNTVGRSFGVFKLHGTGGHDIDVSLPRTESKIAPGHTGFAVTGDPFLPFAEAARRRDFTVNALAVDPRTGEVLDAHGGRDDLAARRLRAVDARSFPEDPLRVWRAVQLMARLGFEVDPGTTSLLRDMVEGGELENLSRERVTEEWRKLLTRAERPSLGFAYALRIGAIEATFPELASLATTPQDPEWHPEGDVWIHTMMVVDEAAAVVRRDRDRLTTAEIGAVLLGALLHDVGKPATTVRAIKDGRPRIISPGHEAAGEAPAAAILGRLSFGEEIERGVLAIVRWHLLPGSLFYARGRGELDDRSYANAVRRTLKRIHPVRWPVLLAACEADWRGRALPGIDAMPFDPGRLFAEAVAAGRFDEAPVTPLVRGRDALDLGVTPGPEVGRLIDEVEAARDRGEIVDREQALVLLRRLVADRPA